MAKSNTNKSDSFIELLGFITIGTLIYHAIKSLENTTKTQVISEDAYKVVKDPDKAQSLRGAVDDYHETGKWNEKELESLI